VMVVTSGGAAVAAAAGAEGCVAAGSTLCHGARQYHQQCRPSA
jgi:hypothetical protein